MMEAANNHSVPAAVSPWEDEEKLLAKAEERILRSWIEQGEALAEIHDKQLHKIRDLSWAAYLGTTWDMSVSYASRVMAAAKEAKELGRLGPLPSSEAAVRPLLKLPDREQRDEAWTEAAERSGGQTPTAKVVAEVVAEKLEPAEPIEEGWTEEGPAEEAPPDPNTVFPMRARLSPACQNIFDREVALYFYTKEAREDVKHRGEVLGIKGLHGPVATFLKTLARIPHPNGGAIRAEGRHEPGWTACMDCADESGISTGQQQGQKCPSCGACGFHVPFARAAR